MTYTTTKKNSHSHTLPFSSKGFWECRVPAPAPAGSDGRQRLRPGSEGERALLRAGDCQWVEGGHCSRLARLPQTSGLLCGPRSKGELQAQSPESLSLPSPLSQARMGPGGPPQAREKGVILGRHQKFSSLLSPARL